MIRGLYGAATALDTAFQNQDVFAQNLAAATVPGYRRVGMSFESFDRALDSARADNPMGAKSNGYYTDFRPGPTIQTGNPLDVALDGDGFFVARGPEGPLYTRDGTFVRDKDGQLRTHGGLPV